MPIDYGSNDVSTSGNVNVSGIITATSGNFTNLLVNGNSFNSSVSGLLPTIANSGDNRILTSTGTSTGINAESNATFDGTNLNISGVFNIDNIRIDTNTISSTNNNGNIVIRPSGTGPLQGDSAGNSRGSYATDWQRVRATGSQVASGSYSVIGGGRDNTSSGSYASVAGGRNCAASGNYSTIAGGYNNRINSLHISSTICGGQNNRINPVGNNGLGYSFIGGGRDNLISDDRDRNVIVGGSDNTISGNSNLLSVICGGQSNSVAGEYNANAFIGGGNNNVIGGNGDNYASVIINGDSNQIKGSFSSYSVIINGITNQISGVNCEHASIINGIGNLITGTQSDKSFIGNGNNNLISDSYYSSILNGFENSVTSSYSTIVGGGENSISGTHYSFIGGGLSHSCSNDYGFIGGGFNQTLSGYTSCIVGGADHTVSNRYATICGGKFNTCSGEYSAIVGGNFNNDGGYNNVFILGSNLTATQANTTYVQNLIASSTGIIPTISGSLLNIDHLRLDGNTLSSTNSNGDILISPNGTGNVGIGTSSPTYKLHVIGSGNFSQDVLVNSISVRNKSLCYFTPLDNQPPVSGFATLDTRNSIAVLDFDDTTNESGVFVGILPENASLASGLNIRIHWAATSATSGTCRWGVQFEKMTSDLDVDSFDATVAESGSTTNATNGIPTITQISCTGIDSLTSGDLFRIVVYRDPADTTNDTMTGDAELIAVEVRSVL